MMRSGSLRHIVTIQAPVYASNTAGDVVISWRSIAAVRAAVRHATASEADRFARLQTVVTHNITLRCRPGIDETMRLIWAGKILQIAEIGLDPTAKKMLNLKCTELKPDTADDPGSASGSSSGSASASGSEREVENA